MHLDEAAQVSWLHPGHTSSKWSGCCWAPVGGLLISPEAGDAKGRVPAQPPVLRGSFALPDNSMGVRSPLSTPLPVSGSVARQRQERPVHCSPRGGACGPCPWNWIH